MPIISKYYKYLSSPGAPVVKHLPAHHCLKHPSFLPHKCTFILLIPVFVYVAVSSTHIGSHCCSVFLPKRVLFVVAVVQSLGHVQPARLLCPWGFPGKNTGVGCHFLLQVIFPTQGSNPHLLHWQVNSLPLSHLGNPQSSVSPPKWAPCPQADLIPAVIWSTATMDIPALLPICWLRISTFQVLWESLENSFPPT